MIDLDGADRHFATRTLGRRWREFSADQRKAAVEQAKRDFSRALGRPMREDEPPFRYGDQVRDEFAVYEQALFSLLRDESPDLEGVSVPSLEPDERQGAARSQGAGVGKWSAEALAWLGASGRVQTVMG